MYLQIVVLGGGALPSDWTVILRQLLFSPCTSPIRLSDNLQTYAKQGY